MDDTNIKLAVGGDVQAKDGTYIKRPADDELFEACLSGEFSYVLACRQIGKSSLKNAVADRLIKAGFRVARIDLNRIGQNVKSAEDWYFSLLDELGRTLQLKINLEEWWTTKSTRLSLTARFLQFLEDVVLSELHDPIVIFIDEIDMTLGLTFIDDFFAAIRVVHNDRSQHPNYKQITFVLLGVAMPDELINDGTRTPFNVGKAISMRDFSEEECIPFYKTIESSYPGSGTTFFEQVYSWTNGHPYLTQKLCQELIAPQASASAELVDKIVSRVFLSKKNVIDDNLRFVQKRVTEDPLSREMLRIYRETLQGNKIDDNPKSAPINRLKLYGLLISNNGKLEIRNKIYKEAFDLNWIRASTFDVFVAGGTLRPEEPSYIERPADRMLLETVLRGEFAYVFASRQLGKSSLMIHTATLLRTQNITTAIIDLTAIGSNVTQDQWYLGLIYSLGRRFNISIDPSEWWTSNETTSPVRKFESYLQNIVLKEIDTPIVIFIDEIDTIMNLEFRDGFFSLIRYIYNSRALESDLSRLSFVLLGVADPYLLIQDQRVSPFNIGRRIELSDFSIEQAKGLERGLHMQPEYRHVVFDRIFYWTSGHPYLTQKLCSIVAEGINQTWTAEAVDKLVENVFIAEGSRHEPNLRFVEDWILRNNDKQKLLDIYLEIYQGKEKKLEFSSAIINRLLLSGLIKLEGEQIVVRNNIYRRKFDLNWISRNSSTKWPFLKR